MRVAKEVVRSPAYIAAQERKREHKKKARVPTETRPKRKKTGGRQKGTPNRMTVLLKEAIIEAAELAGSWVPKHRRPSRSGLINYLANQAHSNPQSFLPLLGRVLPLQIENDGKNIVMIEKIEMVVVDGRNDPDEHRGDDEVLTTIEGTSEVLATDRPEG